MAYSLHSLKCVIFDFDHTLIDTDKAFDVYRHTLLEQILQRTSTPRQEVEKCLRLTTSKLNSQFFAGRLDLLEEKERIFGADLTALCVDSKQILEVVRAKFHDALRPSSSIEPMLKSLMDNGKLLFMFTGGSPVHTIDKLMGCGLGYYFQKIFTGAKHPFEDLPENYVCDSMVHSERIVVLPKSPKSDERSYLKIADLIGVKPEEILMIGNSLTDDVRCSQKAGFVAGQACWYLKETSEFVVPDVVFNGPGDIASMFARVKMMD